MWRSTRRFPCGRCGFATFLPVAGLREWWLPDPHTLYGEENRHNLELALHLREHTPPTPRSRCTGRGVIPYFSERPAIDVLGMSDRHIARLPAPELVPGHSKWDWDYGVNVRRPDVVVRAGRGLTDRAEFVERYVVARSSERVRIAVCEDALHGLRDEHLSLLSLPGMRPLEPAGRGPGRVPVSGDALGVPAEACEPVVVAVAAADPRV